jgi:hypothetical protein
LALIGTEIWVLMGAILVYEMGTHLDRPSLGGVAQVAAKSSMAVPFKT